MPSTVNVEIPSIEDTVQVLFDFKEKGERCVNRPQPSIYMVPCRLRDQSPHSFTPQVVCIGPLHKEDKNVQEFEELKAAYLHLLLGRLRVPPKKTLESCLLKVTDSIDKVRACYSHSGTERYTDVELAKLMVIDACFIIAFFCRPNKDMVSISHKISIIHDLILLENQIPFFVLQYIFDCTIKLFTTTPLTSIILATYQYSMPIKATRNDVDDVIPAHILGLLQSSFRPSSNILPTSSSMPKNKQSIIDLDKAGVKFKPNDDEKWDLGMKFISSRFSCFCHCWGNPTLKMPTLNIYPSTKRIFRNIIAYEQCSQHVPLLFTSYVYAMDIIVNTADDVSKLIESKVIVHSLGRDEDVANLINGLCRGVVIGSFFYGEQWQQFDSYYNSYWPKHIAWLKHTYFNSPWNIIALIAALILFTLTMIQTVFTIKVA